MFPLEGTVGYARRANWGRPVLLAALAAQLAVPRGNIATYDADLHAGPLSFEPRATALP